MHSNQVIICKNCSWSWRKEDSNPDDMYVCHKCGFDNSLYKSSKSINQFYNEFINWYDGISDKLNVFVSVPNEFVRPNDDMSENSLMLDIFEKIDKSVDAKKYMHEFLNIVDANHIDLYLEPIPRYKYIKDEGKKKKLTKDYLINYYKSFGFTEIGNGFMERKNSGNHDIRFAAGGLLAPNGKKSNLTPEQYKLVRTPEFKAWFGDWESDPENASKVVDENGEPRVVYHGTPKAITRWDGTIEPEFYNFNKEKIGSVTDEGFHGKGFYFSVAESYAYGYSYAYGEEGYIFKCFLNIREPLITFTNKTNINNYNDGVLVYSEFNGRKHLYELMVRESNQIKLADGSNKTFDAGNPDVRFAAGGNIKKENLKLKIKKIKTNTDEDVVFYLKDGDEEIGDAITSHSWIEWLEKSNENISEYKQYEYSDEEWDKIKDILRKNNIHTRNGEVFGKHWTLESLDVNKKYRSKGFGRYLMNKVIEYVKKNDMLPMLLWAQPEGVMSKKKLIKFYEGFGFKSIESKKGIMILPKSEFAAGGLLAPNGKKSNLTPVQYKLVRTPEFKAWFGDWESDPENASKVVDENGEPKVMYHGSPNIDMIKVFKSTKGYDYNFFTEDILEASNYSDNTKNIKSFFLNLKRTFNPNNLSKQEKSDSKKIIKELQNWFIEHKKETEPDFDLEESKEAVSTNKNASNLQYVYDILTNEEDNWILLEHSKFQEYIKKNNYDSFITNEGGVENAAVYNSNNIKLADGSNTTFDASNPDIRFDIGGTVDNGVAEVFKSFFEYFFHSDIFKFLNLRKADYVFNQSGHEYVIYRHEPFTNVEKVKIGRFMQPFFDVSKKPLYAMHFDSYKIEGGKIIIKLKHAFAGGGRISPSRLMIPNVRGGWTKEKILRYLKSNGSDNITTYTLAKFISDLDSWEELKDRLYYHGTTNSIEGGLKPSICFSERVAERQGGGGYGDRYWGISLTKRKRTAESFSGFSGGVQIYPVLLKKDARVIVREDLQDASEIEDIIVELYDRGVDAVWIGGGEEELVVVNPESIMLYKKGSQYFSVYGGFKSQQLTDEQIKEIYEKSKLDWEKYYKEYNEKQGKEARQEFLSSIEPFKFKDGGVTETDSFKKWFGNSKIVDEKGSPMIVYHGSPKGDFNIFETDISNNKSNHPSQGLGFFFTPYKDLAEQYSQRKLHKHQEGKNKEAKVFECYLSIKNPLNIEYSEYYKLTEKDGFDSEKMKSELIDKNYDGIIVGNEEIIAFYPNKIKLADGSNTTFDASNPDIRFAAGGKVDELKGKIKIYPSGTSLIDFYKKEYFVGTITIIFDKVENLIVAPILVSGKKKKDYLKSAEYKDIIDALKKYDIKPSDKLNYIEQIDVNESDRGKGYASNMLKQTLDFYKEEGDRYLMLSVGSDNTEKSLNDAQLTDFYKRHGFELLEQRSLMIIDLTKHIIYAAGGAVETNLKDVIALLERYQFRDTKTPIKGGFLSFVNKTKVNGNDVTCFIDTKEKAIVLDSQYGLKQIGYDLKFMEAYFKKNRLKQNEFKDGGRIDYGENEELNNQILAAAQIDKEAIAKATSLIFEDAGYHRGELRSKSDYLQQGYYGDNMGTGYYFISDPKEVVRGGSAKSNPKEFRIVDFSKYRLFRATDANTYWGTKYALKESYRDLCRGESAKSVLDEILKNRNVEWGLKNVIREYRGGEEAQYLKSQINKLELYLDNVKNNREWEQCNKEIDEAKKELSEVEKVGFDTVLAELFEKYEKETSDKDWFQSERFETLMLKALGYEGIDARNIKNEFGMASPDSFSEGSVIFDLKDGTVKTLTQAYIEAKKKNNNPELVAIVDEALEKVNTQVVYLNGGLTDAIEHCFENLLTNGIVITAPKESIALVLYNTGGQQRSRSLYDTALVTRYLGINAAAFFIDKFDKGWYENFTEKEIDELSKFKRIIIINQNEVCFDNGENHAAGGLTYKKEYKHGGGAYNTVVNNVEVSIQKQYGTNTWVAQSVNGEIDIEKETLGDIKSYLESLDENFKIKYDSGGTVSNINNFKNLFLKHGFTEEDLSFLENEKNQFKESYFDGIEFFDDETLIVYRTLALPKEIADNFIKLNKNEVEQGIGEYWTLNKKLAWSIWGGGHYDEETFDVLCTGHLKLKDIDWDMMDYAFNDDIYHFSNESEIRGVKGGKTIKVVKCNYITENHAAGGTVDEIKWTRVPQVKFYGSGNWIVKKYKDWRLYRSYDYGEDKRISLEKGGEHIGNFYTQKEIDKYIKMWERVNPS